jgi:hypothetical protein
MIYDLEHRRVALLVIDAQGEYFDEDGPAYAEHARDSVATRTGSSTGSAPKPCPSCSSSLGPGFTRKGSMNAIMLCSQPIDVYHEQRELVRI